MAGNSRIKAVREAVGKAPPDQTARDMEKAARTIASLQRRRRELKRMLAEVDGKLKIERRFLRALTRAAAVKGSPDTPPMRIFGEGQS